MAELLLWYRICTGISLEHKSSVLAKSELYKPKTPCMSYAASFHLSQALLPVTAIRHCSMNHCLSFFWHKVIKDIQHIEFASRHTSVKTISHFNKS